MQFIKLASVIGATLATLTPAYASGTPAATITGPIPVTAQSGEPFRGLNEQPVAGPGLPLPVLQPYGYVEEEYFVSGSVDGKPYATALLVRKPKILPSSPALSPSRRCMPRAPSLFGACATS